MTVLSEAVFSERLLRFSVARLRLNLELPAKHERQ